MNQPIDKNGEKWKLAPVEPTPEMTEAGDLFFTNDSFGNVSPAQIDAIYRAMLAAATQPTMAETIRDPSCSGDGDAKSPGQFTAMAWGDRIRDEQLDELLERAKDAKTVLLRIDQFRDLVLQAKTVASATASGIPMDTARLDWLLNNIDPVELDAVLGEMLIRSVNEARALIDGKMGFPALPEEKRILICPGDVEEHAGMLVVTNIEVRKALLAPPSPQREHQK